MLRVKNPDAHLPAIRIDQRHGPPEVSAASLLLVGSPAESSVILRETRGHLHLGSNHPNLFMQVPDLLEIRGASAEFGMSGGLVTNSRGDFLGILANQEYERSGTSIQNTILAIPAETVLPWQQAAVANPAHPPIQLTQSTSDLLWKENPLFASESLVFGFIDAFGNGRRILYIASGPESGTLPFAETGFFKYVKTTLSDPKNAECLWYVRGFLERSTQIRRPAPGSLFETLRLLQNPRLNI